MVEKPLREEAPSNLSIVGRYILPPDIFGCLERTVPGAKGEIQLTDGMLLLLESQDLYAYEFQGIRYDGGTPLGLLRATLEHALRRDDTGKPVRAPAAGPGFKAGYGGERLTSSKQAHLDNAAVIQGELTALLDGMDYCLDWKPDPESWSAREVLYHLLDTPPGGIHKVAAGIVAGSITEYEIWSDRSNMTPGAGGPRPGANTARHPALLRQPGPSVECRQRRRPGRQVGPDAPENQGRAREHERWAMFWPVSTATGGATWNSWANCATRWGFRDEGAYTGFYEC